MKFKNKKIRNLINLIMGFDGQQLEIEIGEMRWAQKYHSLTFNSSWLTTGVYPGGWAVGYSFLCVLYRILDELKPNNILELGLGQSTKLTSCFAHYERETFHCIVEHDPNWIAFMNKSVNLEYSHIAQIPLAKQPFKGDTVTIYKDFVSQIPQRQYDLILIDAPFGSEGKYSRIDVLSLIPHLLAKDFVIMMDDCDREGEKNTFHEIMALLENYHIKYTTKTYYGQKNVCLIVSLSNFFVCTMD